jgi:hypothetical protein
MSEQTNTAEAHKRPPAQSGECRCNCGYRCGGPGRCGLGVLKCLQTDDGKHYVRDCDHKWDGPWKELPNGGSATCSGCGMTACEHDMMVGP